ncbi:MAG: hypothetical protein WCC21_10820 [Candidatus Acidiferrales bacterium]
MRRGKQLSEIMDVRVVESAAEVDEDSDEAEPKESSEEDLDEEPTDDEMLEGDSED